MYDVETSRIGASQLTNIVLAEYFLEDCIQMTNFVPPPMDRKKRDKDEDGGDDDVKQPVLCTCGTASQLLCIVTVELSFSFFCPQTNCNMICGPEYTVETKRSMALINEKETSFELVETLLKYIETLQVAGAVLIFLPGWNLIYSLQRHLETNPHFGAYVTPAEGGKPPLQEAYMKIYVFLMSLPRK